MAGGGPAGLGAALMARRNGADVLLVEQFNFFGGMATAGLVGSFVATAGMGGGVSKELMDRASSLGGRKGVYFDLETFKYAAQCLLEEAGVRVLLHSFMESAVVENGVVKGIWVANKGGRLRLDAKVVIDATGDGDVAASAGAPYEKGRKEDGQMQAVTLRSRIGGVRVDQCADWKEINRLLADEIRQGGVHVPLYVAGVLDAGGESPKGERSFNLDMVAGVDATDPWELSRAELAARTAVWELVDFAKRRIPGWKDCYLIDTGVHIGVRETRRILGRYVLGRDDVMSGRKFEDGIARCSNWMDLHDPEVFQHKEGFERYIEKTQLPEGEWYEIPYRCLTPEKPGGILICGRCLSSDREANGSLRIMVTCINTGMAAGVGAALAAGRRTLPSEVDGAEVRRLLQAQGAEL